MPMPARSTIARLQQATTMSLLAAALAWLGWHWAQAPGLAVAGFVGIALAYSAVLALEFIALWFVGRADAALHPTWPELARAWLGETLAAPRVFCWRQPFRWREVPDHLVPAEALYGRRGVVLIHGFLCNRGFWNPWMKQLRARRHAFVAVNLEPAFGSIDDYAPVIEHAVQQVTGATGMAPVLLCHSMGGLAARAWLRSAPTTDRVHRVITIGSPHGGTWLGQLSHLRNGREMRLNGRWLAALAEYEAIPQAQVPFTCWYSNCDNVVFPVKTAALARADNLLVRGQAHVALAFCPQVMAACLVLIAQ